MVEKACKHVFLLVWVAFIVEVDQLNAMANIAQDNGICVVTVVNRSMI